MSRGDAGGCEPRAELARVRPRCIARVRRASRAASRRSAILLRLRIAESKVLQLPLELPDAKPAGERGVDLAGLERCADLLFAARGLQRAQLRELQREPDQDQPHIGRQRDQQFAQPFGLSGP